MGAEIHFEEKSMKKYTWIVALLIALSVVFMGCPSGIPIPPEPEFEWVDVWELATDENIQALPEGKITFGDGEVDPQPIKPLMRAGDNDAAVTVKAVAGPEDQAIALEFTTGADWGAGFDLLSAEFGFQVEDEITVTGEVLAIGTGGNKPQFQMNGYIGNEYTLSTEDTESGKASTTEVGPFEWTVILDDEAITNIKKGTGGSSGGAWPGIRLAGNGKDTKVRIDNIKIAGNRPTNLAALAAPVIELTETGVKWAAVTGAGGYKVLVGAATEEKPTATLGAAATSYNIKANKDIADGSHKVTVIATGEKGVSKDSPASNEVTYVKDTSGDLLPGAKPDGSYVLDPTAWKSWYGSSLAGDTISFDGGGMYYLYPTDDPAFDISSYGSLVINFTAVVTQASTLAGKDGEAAVALKLIDSGFAGLGGGNYGTDIDYKNLTLHFQGGANKTWTINDNSDAAKKFAAAGFLGFAIGQNNGDSNAKFDVTFHSIVFWPAE